MLVTALLVVIVFLLLALVLAALVCACCVYAVVVARRTVEEYEAGRAPRQGVGQDFDEPRADFRGEGELILDCEPDKPLVMRFTSTSSARDNAHNN